MQERSPVRFRMSPGRLHEAYAPAVNGGIFSLFKDRILKQLEMVSLKGIRQ